MNRWQLVTRQLVHDCGSVTAARAILKTVTPSRTIHDAAHATAIRAAIRDLENSTDDD